MGYNLDMIIVGYMLGVACKYVSGSPIPWCVDSEQMTVTG